MSPVVAPNHRLLPDPEPRAIRVPIISVDDHLIEPPDLFEGRLSRTMTGGAPGIVELDGGQQPWICEGNLYPNVELAAPEIRRYADRGFAALRVPEFPSYLGFNSIFSGQWDPLLSIEDPSLVPFVT